jgi:membrane fusion protein, multidrug efflux system
MPSAYICLQAASRVTAIALVLLLFSGCAPKAASQRRPQQTTAPVVTVKVERREYRLPIEAIGTARALESVLVTSRVSGRVSRIYMTEGALVKEGGPLVLLEDDSERAALRSATASAAQAESHYQRLQTLADQGLVSRYERDNQRRLRDIAEAQLELAKVMLDQRTIRAPFSGILGFRQISPGTLVQPGTGIVTLDAREKVRVSFSVAETLISNLNVGDGVEAGAAAHRGLKFTGKIETIGTRVDESTRSIPVHAIIDNDARRLLPGMMLTISIMARPRILTYVPEAALAPENARQFVWRVHGDDLTERVDVEVGIRGEGWVEILSGLDFGDRVVVEGSGNLRPGRAVREVQRPGLALAVPAGES